MKNLQKGVWAILLALCISVSSCGPNDNKGAEDTGNSKGEGSIDSTRLTNFDSASTLSADSSKIK